MASVGQIFTLLGKSVQNVVSPKPKWRFSCMTIEQKDKELAHSQLSSTLNQESTIIEEVESMFGTWNNTPNAFSFFNGRSALDALIQAFELEAGDEAILSPYCCVAVSNAFKFRNIDVTFVDIEPDSLSLDVAAVQKALSEKTKMVVIPHIMGYVARDLIPIKELCAERGIVLIEDCAQSLGAKLNNQKVGNFGDGAFFSFEKSKIITCITGGIATCQSSDAAQRIREIQLRAPFPELTTSHQIMRTAIGHYQKFRSLFRVIAKPWINQLKRPHFLQTTLECELQGQKPANYGYRMDSLTASLLFYQLRKLNGVLKLRIKTAKKWQKKLESRSDIEFLIPIENSVTVFCRLPFKVDAQSKANGDWDTYKKYRLGMWYSTLLDPADAQLEGLPVAHEMCKRLVNLPTILN